MNMIDLKERHQTNLYNSYIHYHNNSYDEQYGTMIAQKYFLQKSNALASYIKTFRQHIDPKALSALSTLEDLSDSQTIEMMNQAIADSAQQAINRTKSHLLTFGDDIAAFRDQYKTLFNNHQAEFSQVQQFLSDASQLFTKAGYDTTFISTLIASLPSSNGPDPLGAIKFSGGQSAKGRNFGQFLQDFLIANEGKILRTRENAPVINFIQTLSKRLEAGATKKKGSFSSRKMTAAITNIFNEGAGEYAIGEIIGTMATNNTNGIIDSFLTGAVTHNVIGIDNKVHAVKIKPDVYGQGVQIRYSDDLTSFSFQTDIGASIKTYKTNSVTEYGVKLGNRYIMPDLINKGVMRYHGANILLHSEEGANYLYGFLVKQYLHLLLSGSGKQSSRGGVFDYSNILIVNGKVYSIYDLINRALQISSIDYFSECFPVHLSGGKPSQGKWSGKHPSWAEAYIRSKEANSIFDKMKYNVNLKVQALRRTI